MKEKRKTLDKESKNLQFKKLFKKQKLQERGITLIALVVTIIILLILSGVTLNIALSDNGLFSKTKEATEKYEQDQKDEEEVIRQIATQMYSEYVGAYVDGITLESGIYEIEKDTSGLDSSTDSDNKQIEGIGEDFKQTFTTETSMKWRIWDFDGNTLRLISEKPTEAKLYLKGATGYNNGVWAINEICRQCYGKIKIGEEEVSTEVANLRRSDIEAVSNYDYTKYKHGNDTWNEVLGNVDDEDLIYYGDTIKCQNSYKSPAMWSKHDNTWTYKYDSETGERTGDKSTEVPWEQEYESKTENKIVDTDKGAIFTQSYYYHEYLNKQGEFKETKYYDLLFKDRENNYFGESYWLAGRCVLLLKSSISYGLNVTRALENTCRLDGNTIFGFTEGKNIGGYTLRPMITIDLKSNGYDLVPGDGVGSAEYELAK